MESYDVVIVGAGLAGLQCARLLGERGFRVVLVDRKASLDQSVHTTGIFVRRTLEDFALPEDCLGPPVRYVTLYSPARRSMELASPYDEFRVGRMAALYRRFLDKCIHAGVEWLPSTRYVEATPFEGAQVVHLEGPGCSRWIKARYVVGADGAISRVASDLGLDANREWIVGVEEVFVDVAPAGPPRFHCFLDPRVAPGYLAWAVHDGQEVHVGVGGYPSLFDPMKSLQQFKSTLAGTIDLSRGRMVERRGGRIPVGGVLRNIANARGLLIGDAAGAVSPLTAGGLDPCMRLSTIAARVIGDYLDTDEPQTLSRYSGDLFRARFVSRLWMRKLIAAAQSPLWLEIGCALMRLPVLDSLAWHVFFGRGSFPDVELQTVAPRLVEST